MRYRFIIHRGHVIVDTLSTFAEKGRKIATRTKSCAKQSTRCNQILLSNTQTRVIHQHIAIIDWNLIVFYLAAQFRKSVEIPQISVYIEHRASLWTRMIATDIAYIDKSPFLRVRISLLLQKHGRKHFLGTKTFAIVYHSDSFFYKLFSYCEQDVSIVYIAISNQRFTCDIFCTVLIRH